MKKIIFLVSTLILTLSFMIGSKTYAYESNEEGVTKSYTYNNEDGERIDEHHVEYKDVYLSGYLIFDRLEISNYKTIELDFSCDNDTFGVLLTNIDKQTNNYVTAGTITIDSCYLECGREGSEVICNNYEYKYLYYACSVDYTIPKKTNHTFSMYFDYLDISATEGLIVEGIEDNVVSSGEFINIYNYSSFFNVISDDDYDVKIKSDGYSKYSKINGTYKVVYEVVTDYTSKEYELTIVVNIINAPKISSSRVTTVIDVSNPVSLDTLKSSITAYDKEDGDLTSSLVFDTNYDSSNLSVGEYYLNAYVFDSDSNKTEVNLVIYVVDTEAPTIKNEEVNLSYSKKYSNDEIFNMLEPNDNYDSNVNYTITSTKYTSNTYDKLGTYIMGIKVYDSSENFNIYTITINVVDDIAPGVETNNITTNSVEALGEDIIKEYIKVTDISEYDITLNMDDYKNNYDKSGSYNVGVSVKDKYNNVTDTSLVITVIVTNTPVIYYNNVIKIYTDNAISHEKLVEFLRQTAGITDSTSVSVLTSDYFTNTQKEGEYSAELKTTSIDGHETTNTFSIIVVKKEEANNTKKKSFWARVGDWFKNIWKSISKFFKSLNFKNYLN